MSKIVSFFSTLGVKFYAAIASVFAFILFVLKIRHDWVKQGQMQEREKMIKQQDELRKKYEEIDNSKLTVDDAIDSLRERSKRKYE